MKEISVTRARPKLSELVKKAARGKHTVIAQKGKSGEEKAVLLGLGEFEGMKRQLEFRQLFEDTRVQLRTALKIDRSVEDDAALQAADDLVQHARRERHARGA